MAIVSVTENPEKEQGGQSGDGRTYTRVFIVKTDDPVGDRSPEALAAIDPDFVGPEAPEDTDRIPRLGEGMPGDEGSTVRDRVAKPLNRDRSVWEVVVDYDSSTESDNEDPTDDEPKISFSFTQYTRPVVNAFKITNLPVDPQDPLPDPIIPFIDAGPPISDRFNPIVPVLASSQKPFNPPHVQEFGNLLISIRTNEDTIDPEDFKFFKDTINDRTITIASVVITPAEGRMRNYATSGSKQFKPDGSGTFWIIAIDIELNARTWVSKFLDLSFYRLSGGDPVLIRDENEEEIVEPALLDGGGLLLSTSADPVFLRFFTYYPANWDNILATLPTGI